MFKGIVTRVEIHERAQKNNFLERLYVKIRYKYAYEYLQEKKNLILDMGCGEGYGLDFFGGKAERLIGVDYSKDAIEQAKDNFRHREDINFLVMDACQLGFNDQTIDAVCAFEILEHLENPKEMLKEIDRVLKDKGTFILSTPNRVHFDKLPLKNPFHIKEYTHNELKMLLEDAFNIEKFYGIFLKFKRFEDYSISKIYNRIKDFLHLQKWMISQHIKARLFGGLSINDYYLSDKNLESCSIFFVVCRKK